MNIYYIFHVSLRWQGDIRGRPCLPSLAEEGGAPPHHQPQLLCRNQRPRNRTTDVKLFLLLSILPYFELHVKLQINRSCVFKGLLNLCLPFRIKEKFPYAFDDICLYSEVSHLLAHCMFRLTSRRFIQELFQDVQFMPVSENSTPSLFIL